jgi:hypothetical protein
LVAQLLKNKQNALGEVLAGRDLPRDAKLIAVMTDIDLAAPNEPEASPSKAAIVAKPETALESPYKESKAARSKEKSSSAVQKSLAQKRKREEVDEEKKEAEKKKEKKRERKNRKKEEEKKKKQKNQQFVGKQVRKFFPGEDDEGGQWYEGEVTELKKCKDDGSSEDEEAGKVAINPDEVSASFNNSINPPHSHSQSHVLPGRLVPLRGAVRRWRLRGIPAVRAEKADQELGPNAEQEKREREEERQETPQKQIAALVPTWWVTIVPSAVLQWAVSC